MTMYCERCGEQTSHELVELDADDSETWQCVLCGQVRDRQGMTATPLLAVRMSLTRP